MTAYLAVFAITFLASLLLLATRRWHARYSLDDCIGVQKHHTRPTPRIGGVALFLGLASACLVTSGEARPMLLSMLLASIPAFAFGLLEDLTKRVSAGTRLMACMLSGLIAWYITGVAMQDTGVPALDWMLGYLPLAVAFTAFAVAGVSNAVNIIDGFNGLAAGAVAIMAGAMGLISLNVGDTALAAVCCTVAALALGFGAVNWPMGRLFLGDGGAYLLGFMVAWVAVLLPMRTANIHAWATILVCAYPVLEVGFSVHRRSHRKGHHPGQPDRVHLHHLIHRRIICKLFPGLRRDLKNGLTSPLCWIITALPAGYALLFAQNDGALALGFGACIFFYAGLYARLSQFRWCFSAWTLRPLPATQKSEAPQ